MLKSYLRHLRLKAYLELFAANGLPFLENFVFSTHGVIGNFESAEYRKIQSA